MDVKQRIRDAQGVIINNLVTCESLISELYEEYGRSDPELSRFWQRLAAEEQGHANQLKSLLPLLDKGVVFKEIGRFDSASIAPISDLITRAVETVRRSPLSRYEALSVALQIESSLIDSHFYDLVHSDSSEYQTIANLLRAATQNHVNLVRDKFVKTPKTTLT